MAELIFIAEEDSALGDFLRVKKGVSRRLLASLKHREGGITCNGVPARTVDRVKKGDVIILSDCDGESLEPNPDLHIPVVFGNESLVVFNKPPGVPVHPSHKHRSDTLGNWFAHLYPGLTFRPVSRLDANTSGLCIAAMNPHAANRLQGRCSKVYYAAVHGLTEEYGTIDAPVARERESIILRCVREDGRKAVTHYRRLSYNGKYSLLRLEPETGRTHQIRVHCAWIGHPLAGDDLYGGSREDISRHALHCGEITFPDPMTGDQITLSCPLPRDIQLITKENDTMEKIASFQVDHTKFGVGMYISRIDGDVITYDVRMVKPNGGTYISSPSMHTIEHLFATYARSSAVKDGIIYVGPMGCRTGFYLLTRDTVSKEQAIALVRDAYRFISEYTGEIPGCTPVECGNYLEHDLEAARRDVLPLLRVLENYSTDMLEYSWHTSQK